MAEEFGSIPENIIYTKERPGVWKGKDGSHLPVVTSTKEGAVLKVTVETKHGMSDAHFIVRHVIISEAGEVLGAKTFTPKDKPVSTHDIMPRSASICTRYRPGARHSGSVLSGG